VGEVVGDYYVVEVEVAVQYFVYDEW